MSGALLRVDRAVFEPASLPDGAVFAIGLVPAVAAGLFFFGTRAAVALAVAAAAGVVFQLGSRVLALGPGVGPAIAPLVAVALLGPAAPIEWIAIAATLAGALELARRRWLPSVRAQAGLLAAVAVFLASRGLTSAYLNPGRLRPLAEPIRLWETLGSPAAAPIDAVRLYVGNVPGPMFATSLLAVLVGAAWLWYARRLSLAVLVAFVAGAALPIAIWHWNAAYQLESGPAWFVVALLLADRANLPTSRAARPLLGLAAGLAGVGLRNEGLGIEAMMLAGAGLQLTVAGVSGLGWLLLHRRRMGVRASWLRRGAVKQVASPPTAA